jgi:hypothetical protein
MGTYSIIIEGHGINHNGTSKDADEMAKAFVHALRSSGQAEVKGYFVYGPKLATSFVEETMKRGFGSKMAEPLAPLCDHKTWVREPRGGEYAQACTKEAVFAKFDAREVVTVRCADHSTPTLEDEGDWQSIRPAVMA